MARKRDPMEYEPPPDAPGLSDEIRHLSAMQAWSTRQILRAIARDDADVPAGPGLGAWAASTLKRVPLSVQIGMVLSSFYMVLQLGSAAYEGITGRAPPQNTQPVSFPAAEAHDGLTPTNTQGPPSTAPE